MKQQKKAQKEDIQDMKTVRRDLERSIKKNYKSKCKHEFVHVSNKGWWGCSVVIYCKRCGCGRSC